MAVNEDKGNGFELGIAHSEAKHLITKTKVPVINAMCSYANDRKKGKENGFEFEMVRFDCT